MPHSHKGDIDYRQPTYHGLHVPELSSHERPNEHGEFELPGSTNSSNSFSSNYLFGGEDNPHRVSLIILIIFLIALLTLMTLSMMMPASIHRRLFSDPCRWLQKRQLSLNSLDLALSKAYACIFSSATSSPVMKHRESGSQLQALKRLNENPRVLCVSSLEVSPELIHLSPNHDYKEANNNHSNTLEMSMNDKPWHRYRQSFSDDDDVACSSADTKLCESERCSTTLCLCANVDLCSSTCNKPTKPKSVAIPMPTLIFTKPTQKKRRAETDIPTTTVHIQDSPMYTVVDKATTDTIDKHRDPTISQELYNQQSDIPNNSELENPQDSRISYIETDDYNDDIPITLDDFSSPGLSHSISDSVIFQYA